MTDGSTKSRTPANKGKRYHAEPLTDVEVKALLAQCSRRAPTGIRNRALITVLYRCGLRISEALNLYLKDYDAQAGTIRILNGKGGKSRTVAIDPGAADTLQLWINKRATFGLNGRQPIFCTITDSRDGKLKAGSPLKTAYIRTLMKRIGEKAGIAKRVHAHGLRHSFAVSEVQRGVPVAILRLELGHGSLSTTSVYVDGLNPQAAIDSMRNREWSPD